MVNHDHVSDPVKALEYKEKGNKCFVVGDWTGAADLYTQAIECDPTNPFLYTNRSMAFLKLGLYLRVIADTERAISLQPQNMKAYFRLAQAQIELHRSTEALSSARIAHELCVKEICAGTKDGSSIGMITDLVLRCKKEDWEKRETERISREPILLGEVIRGLEEKRDREIQRLKDKDDNGLRVQNAEDEYKRKIDDVKKVWERSTGENKREVPNWCIDDITFSVMIDPVVTKTGQSYDRASIVEHLKRSQTDPLTREPLRIEDLRPNLALRAACEEFLENNGWAVEW